MNRGDIGDLKERAFRRTYKLVISFPQLNNLVWYHKGGKNITLCYKGLRVELRGVHRNISGLIAVPLAEEFVGLGNIDGI